MQELYELLLAHPLISTDSRNCPTGSIFFALKGPNFDANRFASQAIANGCSYAIIDDDKYAVDKQYIVVNNVLKTLQDLAAFHRQKMGINVIAITGSNGKTTTKELIAHVLKQKYNVLYTEGNLNNHIGVPLTLLKLKPEHQLAIIEMGANHPGEIQTLCEIAKPEFGIITNVGKAHLEGFGSLEGVMKAKAELYDFIATKGKGVFVNIDNDLLKKMWTAVHLKKNKLISYSIQKHPDMSLATGKITGNSPYLEMECQTGAKFKLKTNLIGEYNAENILAAITIGHFFGISINQLVTGIQQYVPDNNRSQFTSTEKNDLIIDAYNANPTSMELAIQNLASLNVANKAVILGDMLELGVQSVSEHERIIQLLQQLKFSQVFLVGQMFHACNHTFASFASTKELQDYLSTHEIKHHHILIKGSRGIQMEKIIHLL